MKKLLLILLLTPILISSQYVSKNSGDWTNVSNWLSGISPPLTGGSKLSDDVTISEPTQITLNNNLELQSGAMLIVEGTLIITGNITFKNGSALLVQVGGILHILTGGTNSNNSTNVIIEGEMIVDGDFEAGAGSTITGGGLVTVGGTSSGSGTIFGLGTGCSGCSFSGGSSLPIELISFEAEEYNNSIHIMWVVASQINNDFYTIYKSNDAYNWDSFIEIPGSGNSNSIMEYECYDENIVYGTVYYKLRQTDYDAVYEEFPPISVTILDPDRNVILIRKINLLGCEVDDYYNGLIFKIYNNGKVIKDYQHNFK